MILSQPISLFFRWLLFLTAIFVWGCSQGFQTQSFEGVSTAAESKKDPEVINLSPRQIPLYRGNLQSENIKIEVDASTQSIQLTGKVKLKDQEIAVHLKGNYNDDGYATLTPTQTSLADKIKIRSKVMCKKMEAKKCLEIIADIFAKDTTSNTYHVTQVESQTQPSTQPTVPAKPSTPAEAEPDAGEPDFYVGQIYTDFENLFDESPNTTTGNQGLDPNRPFDQAIGMTSDGSLRNATDLIAQIQAKKLNDQIKVPNAQRQRYFGTYELVEVVLYLGNLTKALAVGFPLQVSDLSQKNGGHLLNSAHASHQNGLDADIGYYTFKGTPFTNIVNNSSVLKSDFQSEKTLKLFMQLNKDVQDGIDRIFVNKVVKNGLCQKAVQLGLLQKSKNDSTDNGVIETLRRLRIWEGHDDHFHLRLKCSRYQPRCRQMTDPPAGPGC